MVYRNHLVLILGYRLFSEVIQYFRCTLGCLNISSDIQCAVFKEQCRLQLDLIVISGDKGIRTLDPLLARQVLSQLSYTPRACVFCFNGVKRTRTSDLTLIRRAL